MDSGKPKDDEENEWIFVCISLLLDESVRKYISVGRERPLLHDYRLIFHTEDC